MAYCKLQQKNPFFMLDNCLHRQIDGVAMGSPLGPKCIFV